MYVFVLERSLLGPRLPPHPRSTLTSFLGVRALVTVLALVESSQTPTRKPTTEEQWRSRTKLATLSGGTSVQTPMTVSKCGSWDEQLRGADGDIVCAEQQGTTSKEVVTFVKHERDGRTCWSFPASKKKEVRMGV